MKITCSSGSRCLSASCESCSWRYSLHVSRRIIASEPRRLFAVTFSPFLSLPSNFSAWRVQIRNSLDYRRRRASRWWREVGLWLWLSADGHVHGIASLGSVTEAEFLEAFGRRWPTTLKAISVEGLRAEVYFAMRPRIIFNAEPHGGRYQSLRLAVEPRQEYPEPTASDRGEAGSKEPLPVLI